MHKVANMIGARPGLTKVAPIIAELRKHGELGVFLCAVVLTVCWAALVPALPVSDCADYDHLVQVYTFGVGVSRT